MCKKSCVFTYTSVAGGARNKDKDKDVPTLGKDENLITHDVNGVLLHHKGLKKSFTLAVSALQVTEDGEEVVNVSTKIGFDPMSGASNVWNDLREDGRLTNKIGKFVNYKSELLT